MSGGWRWSLVVVAVLGAVAAAVPLLLYWPELPDPIAVHWSARMRPDGATSKSAALWPPIVLILAMLLVSLINSARAYAHGRAVRLAIVTFGSAMSLAPGARAVWTGSATNRWLIGVGAYLLVQAFVLQVLIPQLRAMPIWLAVHAVAFVTLELFSRVAVTIDGRCVAIRYGHLGLWTRRVPLAEIAAARSLTLDALGTAAGDTVAGCCCSARPRSSFARGRRSDSTS